MCSPKKHGGPGCSYLDAALVVEETVKVCRVTGRFVLEGILGAVSAIYAYSTQAQIDRVLPLVLANDKPVFASTAPVSGTVATAMRNHSSDQS